MFNSFSAALSSMKAHSAAVDTVGNNLANVNTTGFKSIDIAFKDLVSESLSAKNEKGMGLSRPITVRSFSQGAIQTSSGKLDAAINGNGFFVVKDNSDNVFFTRDGTFQLDSYNMLRTLTGEKVQQFQNGTLQDIRVSTGFASPTPTTQFTLGINLDAGSAVGTKFSAPVDVVDSLGARHLVTVTYTKAAGNQWNYDIDVPAADLATPPTGPVASGTIDFNSDGTLNAVNPGTGSTGGGSSNAPIQFAVQGLANSAADLSLSWNLLDVAGNVTMTQFTQNSSVSSSAQDGSPSSELVDVGVVDGGVIVGRYGTGEQRPIGTLAMSLIQNPDSLTSVGNNLLRATADTAKPRLGIPGVGGFGNVKAQALEASTVDIAREFTNLIVFQRGYQANSRVITTADEMSQETLNLKR